MNARRVQCVASQRGAIAKCRDEPCSRAMAVARFLSHGAQNKTQGVRMKVRFWGTRGSIAKPGPETVRYGGNTSCVQVTSPGGQQIIIDCGTGAHDLGQHILKQ